MTKKEGETKSGTLRIRIVPDDLIQVKKHARETGISPPEVARRALRQEINKTPDIPNEIMAKLVKTYIQLIRIGTNMNQISRKLNGVGIVGIEEIKDAHSQLATELKQVRGHQKKIVDSFYTQLRKV